jgi:hypothetical protein
MNDAIKYFKNRKITTKIVVLTKKIVKTTKNIHLFFIRGYYKWKNQCITIGFSGAKLNR